MPEQDGWALATALRARPGGQSLPLILLAPRAGHAPRPDLGVLRTLRKPVKQRALREAVALLLAPGPVATPAPTGAPAGDTLPRLAAQYPLRLLLAEDNELNQRVAALILQGMGYELEIVDNGERALDALQAAEAAGQPFDLVLLDIQMPVLDGLSVARHLRARQPDAARRPYLLAMTANALEGDRADCMAAGMDDYMAKPIRATAVADALRRGAQVLAQRRAAGVPATGFPPARE